MIFKLSNSFWSETIVIFISTLLGVSAAMLLLHLRDDWLLWLSVTVLLTVLDSILDRKSVV